MSLRVYTPHRWKIIKFTSNNEKPYCKVLAVWRGGYLDSDNWRLSSMIETIEEKKQDILFKNVSKSLYKCKKNTEGNDIYLYSMIQVLKNQVKNSSELINIEEVSIDSCKEILEK